MKVFQVPQMEGGVQLQVLVLAKTKKEAAAILNVSLKRLNDYASIYDPKDELLISNPGKRFAYFDSGWLREHKPDWFRKIMPYEELKNYIQKVNKKKYDTLFKIKSKP